MAPHDALRLSEIDAQIRVATPVDAAAVAASSELVGRIDLVWGEATANEKARIAGELIDSALLDMRAGRIAAIVPQPGFRLLLEDARNRSGAAVELIAPRTPEGGGAGGDGGGRISSNP